MLPIAVLERVGVRDESVIANHGEVLIDLRRGGGSFASFLGEL